RHCRARHSHRRTRTPVEGNAMNNKPDNQTIPPTVSDAERVIGDLQAKRDALVEHGRQLDQVRASYAFAAHALSDQAARRALDQVNKETAEHGSELASLDAAIKTAQQRLEAAQRHEAKQAEREQAVALRDALARFQQHAAGVDAALQMLVESCNGMQDALVAM